MKNRVKELRDAKHLTQTGLALKVGSTQQTISKIEREIGVPKLDLALIMADFFNVTLEYLFCLSDKKHKLEHQIEMLIYIRRRALIGIMGNWMRLNDVWSRTRFLFCVFTSRFM